jgi:ABC-type dipeptide/oligopeptide/nickel transport system ATPase component
MPMLSSALLHARLSAAYGKGPEVLRDVEFEVEAGEIVGLVGESGSGKSTIALAILRLLEYRGGTVRGTLRFQGRDLLRLSERQMRAVRGREIGLVLQSPLSSLNPAMTVGEQIREAWAAHPTSASQGWSSLLELLDAVNLPTEEEFLHRCPRQISVGQAQRVLIAMAIVHRPALLVADEPTSALDTVTQAEIVKLFARLNRQLGMSILYISHDLLSVASLCHRIAILRHGRMVESGTTREIFWQPRDRYTRALLAAIPSVPFPDNLSTESVAR